MNEPGQAQVRDRRHRGDGKTEYVSCLVGKFWDSQSLPSQGYLSQWRTSTKRDFSLSSFTTGPVRKSEVNPGPSGEKN